MEQTPLGKFIVIDGTDGSGKETQTKLLVERLARAGFDVMMADFPQYGRKSAGMVEEYLNGKYGDAQQVGPYRASIFYAVDRYSASFQIKQWLKMGKVVIANRYVTANLAHQGGKINDEGKRKAYFDWLYDLEYNIFGIPQPDVNIILHVDAAIAQRLVDSKNARGYLNGGKRDIHETDLNHLRNAEQVYLELKDMLPNCALIECTAGGKIMKREKISDMIWREVIKFLPKNNFTQDQPNQTEISIINETNNHVIQTINTKDELQFKKPNEADNIFQVKKITPEAKLPTRAHADDAGLDVYANGNYTLYENERATISTGIALAIPSGHVGLIWDKSGLASGGLHTMGGVIDSDYRGELKVVVINLSGDVYNIQKGQKIAQLLIQKKETLMIKEVSALDETARDDGGFGSSGLF